MLSSLWLPCRAGVLSRVECDGSYRSFPERTNTNRTAKFASFKSVGRDKCRRSRDRPAPCQSLACRAGSGTCAPPGRARTSLAEKREVPNEVEAAVPAEPFPSGYLEFHEAPVHGRPEPEILHPSVHGAKMAVPFYVVGNEYPYCEHRADVAGGDHCKEPVPGSN